MDFYSFAPVAAILELAYQGVTALITLLEPITADFSAPLAIVILTIMVRAALIPVGRSQVRAEFTRRRIAPKLAALHKKYRGKPEVLQQKTRALYAAEKASPFAGMLPTLAQAPVLSIVYGLFIVATISGHPNGLLGFELCGVPLGTSLVAFSGGMVVWPGVLVYAGLLATIAVVASCSRAVALRFASSQPVDDAAPGAAMMKSMASWISWMPFITVIFASFVPLAATIYLTVTTMWTLVERVLLRRILAPRDIIVQPSGPAHS
ncbi:MAG: YidC/Oxa1 family membrane protein insertase [Microbacteriaceae bacterium]